MEIKNNIFVVTGGAGFIGSHVVDALLVENPAEVRIIDDLSRGSQGNLKAALRDPRVRLIEGDIRDAGFVERQVEGASGCFHLAGLRITQCAAEPRKALEIMVDGTFNVAEAAVKQGVRKIIFSSTASVYGLADQFPTGEMHHPWNNRTWYGATKVCGEGLLRAFATDHGLEFVALRYFNVYGPRMDAVGKYTEVFIRWMECLDRGERPKIFGDGKQTMDFVEVGDVARANVAAMRSELTDVAVNVASGKETSLLELLQTLAAAWGLEHIDPEFMPERKVNPVPRRLADIRQMRENLGIRKTADLKDGLIRLIEWYRSDCLERVQKS